MILKIALCEDDVKQLNMLENYLHRYEMNRDIDLDIASFTSPLLLLEAYSNPCTFHVLFLDVEMPDMNGIELANKIRAIPDKNVRIIFVSNYPQYMQCSFNVQAYHYLQKPLHYEYFENIMDRIVHDYEENNLFKLLVKTDGSELLVNIRDILYIETIKNIKNGLRFHLHTSTIDTKGIMSELEASLNNYSYALSNRGCLVNLLHIRSLNRNTIILDNGEELSLSRRCERDLRKKFSKNVIVFLDQL